VRTAVEPGVASLPVSELRLPARGSELSAARQYVDEAAAAFGFDADGRYECVFAVNEAVTNAIRHGAPDEQGLIHLSVVADGDRLTFAVRDWGMFAIPVWDGTIPALETTMSSEHGRGFALMDSLMDEVLLHLEPGSTVIRLSKVRA
jgi:stage II sporulation protein AB (anti-sigma F factor)